MCELLPCFFRIGLLLVDIGKMDRERLAFWLRGKELHRILEYLMIDLTLSSHRDFVYVPFLQTPVLPKHRIVFSHHQSILRLSHVVLYHQFLIIDWAISLSMHTYPRAFLLLKNTNKNKLSWPIIPVWLPFHFHSLSLFSYFLLTLNPTSSLQWNCSYQSPMTSIFPNSVEC